MSPYLTLGVKGLKTYPSIFGRYPPEKGVHQIGRRSASGGAFLVELPTFENFLA